MPRALLMTGDAAEELDTMYPYYRVQEGGWDVDVASLTMRDIQLVIHEFDPNCDAYVEKNGRKLPVDVTWSEVDLERYDALIIPGGRAPEWIRVDADVRRITEHFFARDLPIALVCHGAQVLAAAGILEGRSCSAYPAVGPDVTSAGGEFVDIAVDSAHRDGNLVTAPAWPAHPQWLATFLSILGTRIEL